jgi:hypothetical protein
VLAVLTARQPWLNRQGEAVRRAAHVPIRRSPHPLTPPETQTTRLTAGPLPLPRLCASPTPIQFQLPVLFVSIAPECLYSLLFTQYSLRFTALPRPRWR